MTRALLFLALIPLSFLSWAAHADSTTVPAATPAQSDQPANRPITLVRVLSLEGTGPDLQEHRLFSDPAGFVTTLDALGRVGYQVGGAGLADGGYHTLFVQLADEYEMIRPDGSRELRCFSDENKTTRVRVRGMIMVRNGQATPLRMLEDPSYYGSHREPFRRGRDGDDD
jgi:hypothetical protein